MKEFCSNVSPLCEIVVHSDSYSPAEIESLNKRTPIETPGIKTALKGLNSSQQKALTMALHHNLLLVHGPPGTGKTSLALALLKVFDNGHSNAVMVGSPSNSACDNVLRRASGVQLQKLRFGKEPRGVHSPRPLELLISLFLFF